MATQADIRLRVVSTVKDDSKKLTDPDDYDRIISAAALKYSRHKPGIQVADITGNGTHDYDLPSGWTDEFSAVKSVEYPVGDVPATMLDNDGHAVYQAPSGKKLRLTDYAPASFETFRVSFTILRTPETVPGGDVDAFVWLAASLCCEELATAFAQTSDATMNADSVDYNDKSRRFASRAKSLRNLYMEHVGLKDGDVTPPASAVSDLDVGYPGGGDRLTHPRRLRERR